VLSESERSTFLQMPGEYLAARRDFSEQTAREVDCAVRDLISQAFERAVGIPEAHRDAPAESAERLLEKETLRGDELPLLNAEPGVQISAADPSQEALHEPAESRRKAAARQAMKRAEDTKG
jgi:cell division protease FtsH